MGEVCGIRMLGPSHCFQRSQLASSSIRVRHLLQSLAPAPLIGPGSSMRRGKASLGKHAERSSQNLCLAAYTTFTALLHDEFLRPTRYPMGALCRRLMTAAPKLPAIA